MIDIDGFERYCITVDYQVINKVSGKVLKPQINGDGYATFNLYDGVKYHHKRRCRLMAQAYLPDYSEELCVNHKDLDKLNDTPDNLEMVTILENNRHSLLNQPEKHRSRAEYTDEQIRAACELFQQGMSPKQVSEISEVRHNVLQHVRQKKCWKHITKDYNFPKCKRVIDEDMARWISKQLIKGLMPTPILRMSPYPEITINSIKSIKAGQTFVNIYQEELAIAFIDYPEREYTQVSGNA